METACRGVCHLWTCGHPVRVAGQSASGVGNHSLHHPYGHREHPLASFHNGHYNGCHRGCSDSKRN